MRTPEERAEEAGLVLRLAEYTRSLLGLVRRESPSTTGIALEMTGPESLSITLEKESDVDGLGLPENGIMIRDVPGIEYGIVGTAMDHGTRDSVLFVTRYTPPQDGAESGFLARWGKMSRKDTSGWDGNGSPCDG